MQCNAVQNANTVPVKHLARMHDANPQSPIRQLVLVLNANPIAVYQLHTTTTNRTAHVCPPTPIAIDPTYCVFETPTLQVERIENGAPQGLVQRQ